MRRQLNVSAVVVGAVLVLLAACGGDDGGGEAGGESQAVRTSRYCQLAEKFDATAVAVGAASAPGRADGPSEAIQAFFAQMGPSVDEMQTTAPGDIREDVGTVVDAMRAAQNGDRRAVDSQSFGAATERMASFRQRNCPVGDGSGEG